MVYKMKHLVILILCILSVVLLWLTYPFAVMRVVPVSQLQREQSLQENQDIAPHAESGISFEEENHVWMETGQFGDTYGGFNALFTALALCGIGFAAWLQYCQLKLQRREMLQQFVPYIESETPVLRFLDCIPRKGGGVTWGLIVDMTIISKGDKDAVNLVSKCQITDEVGKMLSSGACSAEGSVIAKGDKLRLFHHVVFESPNLAKAMIQRLCARKQLTLSIEFHYLNMLGGAFVRKKDYILDCPSSTDRARLGVIAVRLDKDCKVNAIDNQILADYVSEVESLITFRKDIFTMPLIAAISKLAPMVQKSEEECEYTKFYEKVRRDIEKNVFPIKTLKESFSIRV